MNQHSHGKIINSRQSNMNYCATYLNSIFFLGVHCRSPEGHRGRKWASWTEEYLSFGPQWVRTWQLLLTLSRPRCVFGHCICVNWVKKFHLIKLVHVPFVRYFRTLFWDDVTIFWDENLLWFFSFFKVSYEIYFEAKSRLRKGCVISLILQQYILFFFDPAIRKK